MGTDNKLLTKFGTRQVKLHQKSTKNASHL